MYAQCQVCKDEGRTVPFGTPWGSIGRALMQQHFKTEHPDIDIGKIEG